MFFCGSNKDSISKGSKMTSNIDDCVLLIITFLSMLINNNKKTNRVEQEVSINQIDNYRPIGVRVPIDESHG
jgi:hypothetical protein